MQLNNNPTSPLGRTAATKFSIIASPLNAGNVNRYGISANAIAKLKFKIVPVPTPASVSEMRVVPDLVGRTLDAATIALIAQLGFVYRIDGTLTAGTIDTQLPLPSAIGKLGDELVLTLV